MSADSDIQDLQVKVAFLEDSLSKISDEYYQQQRELEKLKMQFKPVSYTHLTLPTIYSV